MDYVLTVVFNDGKKTSYVVRAPNLLLAFEFLKFELTYGGVDYDFIIFE